MRVGKRNDSRTPSEGGTPNVRHAIGEVVEVEIVKIVPGGYGLAFGDGMTFFIALAVPGDRLLVRLREIRGKIAFAEIEKVIEPGAARIEPPCPYVGTCGGCDFQQMTYRAQLDAKVAIIRDNLTRIGKIEYEHEIPIVASPAEFGYRLRAQWHVDVDRREIGYYKRNSRDLVAIAHCPILVPELDEELQRARANLDFERLSPDRVSVDIACGDDGAISAYSPDVDLGNAEIKLSAAGEVYAFNAQAFFQGNRFLIDRLVDVAIGDVRGETALDLYSGVGLFTLPLARRFAKVTAVEDFPLAVEFGRRNVEHAGHANVEIVQQPVGKYLAERGSGDIDFALLDPPRFGTEKKTVLDLIRLRPLHVSYVSCDPSVLARDLRRFLDAGYQIQSITALDLFPQTHHVETVVRLIVDR